MWPGRIVIIKWTRGAGGRGTGSGRTETTVGFSLATEGCEG